MDQKQYIIRWPKAAEGCFAFSHNRKFLAVGERRDNKDFVGVYYCLNWRLVSYFQAETIDLSLLQWAANDSSLLLCDHSISYGLYAYAPTDALVYKDRDSGCLGAKIAELSPKGDYLAILTYDEKLKLYNMVSFRLVITVDLKASEQTHVFAENEYTSHPPLHGSVPRKFEATSGLKLDQPLSLEGRKDGKAEVKWSPSGHYLAIKLGMFDLLRETTQVPILVRAVDP